MFNVGDFTHGIDDIRKYMHTLAGRFPETPLKQHRMLKKWLTFRDALHKRTTLSHDEISTWQLERIATLVDSAFSTNPFYHKLYKSVGYERGAIASWEDYNALPTISKEDIINNFQTITEGLIPPVNECAMLKTSGSSGRSLTIFRDQTAVDYITLYGMRFEEQMLGRRREHNEWLYLIYVTCYPYTSLDGSFPTFAVSLDCPSESILAHLQLLKPAVISSLPNSLLRIAPLIKNANELGIRAINTNSESSTKEERAIISEKFGAPVYDEYSSVELSLIATQCNMGHYHIVEDNVRVDVLDPDKKGMGEIVSTNLTNAYMPIIRYRQGDMIQISNSNSSHSQLCECGIKFRKLETFMGRADQFLFSNAIGKIPPDKVMQIYDRCLLNADDFVDEFKIVQTHADRLQIFMVPTAGHEQPNQTSVMRFVNQLKDLFDDLSLQVDVLNVSEMPANKSYKRRLIINEIAN